MITDQDVSYHTPAACPHDWAETSYFYFYVPEARVMAWIYFVARPGVGAMVCDVQVIGDLSTSPLGAWYTDIQQHLKLPPRFEQFTLSNGLSFETKGDAFSTADACLVPSQDVLYKLLTTVHGARISSDAS